MKRKILLEVAIQSASDAAVAQRAGADRLELCTALHLDGLTPPLDVIDSVVSQTALPVVVMIRPKSGDFVYTENEIAQMKDDITSARNRGVVGFVFGALHRDETINSPQMKSLVDACNNFETICHRAFDSVPDPFRTLEELIDLGVTRVLTSGHEEGVNAPGAMSLIRELRDRAAGRIEILPGGGVRPHNVVELIQLTGCDQIHGSFRSREPWLTTSTNEDSVAQVRRHIDELSAR